ncbi:MAG: undecaprenyl-diphosphate phosphatase [Clostridiales bacterium]|jgi:undecaprenyl pyrophosphate phosphatase UppP|nr:undecaprenyl-diphosphate phosphatase [Clostridiales bacterium]
METINAIILGLIQGLTEFLPVSSSGHLVLAESLGLGGVSLFFNVMLHAGTLLAVLWVFRKDAARLVRHPLKSELRYLLIAMLPTGIIAVLWKLFLPSALLGAYLPFGFIATAAVLTLGESIGKRGLPLGSGKYKKDLIPSDGKPRFADQTETKNAVPVTELTARYKEKTAAETMRPAVWKNETDTGANSTLSKKNSSDAPKKDSLSDIDIQGKSAKKRGLNAANSLLTGVLQGIAVLPGVSRSGFTLSALLLGGVGREQALRFSFLLSIPVILLSAVYEIASTPITEIGISIPALIAGMFTAFISGLFAVKFMIKVFRDKSLFGFAAYTFLLGAGMLIARLAAA